MSKYGYARVSTKTQAKDGNSLDAQRNALYDAGATTVFEEAYTGTTAERPKFQELLRIVRAGDTIVVTKLDRVARSTTTGITLITELNQRNVAMHVLNMGVLDNSPTGKLLRNMMLSFAEFERDLIVERTMEGKALARQNPDFCEGRPKHYTEEQIETALNLTINHSVAEAAEISGVHRSTIYRYLHS